MKSLQEWPDVDDGDHFDRFESLAERIIAVIADDPKHFKNDDFEKIDALLFVLIRHIDVVNEQEDKKREILEIILKRLRDVYGKLVERRGLSKDLWDCLQEQSSHNKDRAITPQTSNGREGNMPITRSPEHGWN
jgi:hypothetical protein